MESYPQYPQTAVDTVPSGNPSEVAPTGNPQAYEQTPGSAPVQDAYQPVAPDQQPSGQEAPVVDYQAQLQQQAAETARLRQQFEETKRQNDQFNQVFGQIREHAEREKAEKEQAERIQSILATADNMSPGEQQTFLRNQILSLQRQEQAARQQAIQQERARAEQAIKMAAMPSYADHITSTFGLPAEAKNELMALGDMDLMYKMAPSMKQRYDQMTQLQQQIQQSSQQQARTNEVNAMRQNGLTQIGGQSASGFNPNDLPSDPEERAMAIYEAIQARKAGV